MPEVNISGAATSLDERSKDLRRSVVRMLKGGGRGHLGASLSLIEILRVLYDDILNFNPKKPQWAERDRCILSKGHGCLALYALLADKGFFDDSELDRFCRKGGILGGHPEFSKVPGVEASTGSLGHGLSLGLGFALAARMDKRSSKVFVIQGDGESNEGSVWEAAMCASKHRLSNLVVMVDYNKNQSYGSTSQVQDLEPFADKWQSFGWAVKEIDGHDVGELKKNLESVPFNFEKPSAIICHTIKGKGVSYAEGNLEWHHKSNITDEQIESMYAEIEAAI